MIRILQFGMSTNYGGIEAFLMNYYRKIDCSKIQFDFYKSYKEKMAYEDEIISMGGKIYYLPAVGIKDGINKIRDSWMSFYANTPVDAIHFNTIALTNMYAVKYAFKSKKTVYVHAHPSHYDVGQSLNAKIRRRINKLIVHKYATELFACSEPAGKWAFGNDFCVIPNSIEVDKFRFQEEDRRRIREQYNITDEYVICNVGRLSEVKNQTFLIDVLFEISKRDNKVKLMLVGNGEKEQALKEKAKMLGLSDKVIFTGMVNDMQQYYSASDLFVFPSLSEGFGIVLLEAQANGLYCVSADTVVPETNPTGAVSYIALNDTFGWAEKILSLKNVNRLDENKISKLIEKYDINNAVRYLERIYMKNEIL